MSVDLSPFVETFECPAGYPRVTAAGGSAYYTVTENVQSLTNGEDPCWSGAGIVKNPTGNSSAVWVRLLDLLEAGDRFVFFTVFWLFAEDVMKAIIRAIERDVICITVMTMETEYNGPGSIHMGNPQQTAQRNSYLSARSAAGNKGYMFPFHNISFSALAEGQVYPWIYQGIPQYGNILHAKMLVWDKASYPAVYVGSQNPEFDDEDMGITVEHCPELVQEALALIDKFIYASILQQASYLNNQKEPAIDHDSNTGKDYFIGYVNYGGIAYLPGGPLSGKIKGGMSWKSIESNFPAILESLRAQSDNKLDSVNFSLDLKLFSHFPLVNKFSEDNRLQLKLADWSNYQNYQCWRQNISFAWDTDVASKNSIFYGVESKALCHLVIGPPQFCLGESGASYTLTSIARTINCAQTNLDIANMDPEVDNFSIYDWIVDAVTRGVHIRLLIGQGQANVKNNSLNNIAHYATSVKGARGSIAIRIWDEDRKFSCFSRGNSSSVYHCKYMLSESRVFFGNQNLNPMFFGSMGGVGMVIEDSGPLRDQFQNYFNRDWESPFVSDFLDRWLTGAETVGLDPCFTYGPVQTNPSLKGVPKSCRDRQKPWSDHSFYKTSSGRYLGACSGASTTTGCCLPKDLIPKLTSNCELDWVVAPQWSPGICQPASQVHVPCTDKLDYRVVITIPQPQYGGQDVFTPNSRDPYNPPDGDPTDSFWTETYSAWIAATDRASVSIDCVLIYSNLLHDKLSTAYGFYQALTRAVIRGVRLRLIFCYPPNANWDESKVELLGLKNAGGKERSNVELYHGSYLTFMESDQTKMPFISPDQGPSSGILHTKLYIWDNEEAYVGAQNQEVPIAIESGIMLKGDRCLVNDLKKVADFYVLNSCLQCRGVGVTSLAGLENTPEVSRLKTKFTKQTPHRVTMRSSGSSQFKNLEMVGDVYVSATPLSCAKIMGRTFDVDAIVDVMSRAKSDVYIAAMDLSDLTDFYSSFSYFFNEVTLTKVNNARFSSIYDAIIGAVRRGVNVKILVGLRRSFGDAKPEPCGYNPRNVASLMSLCEEANKAGPGSLHAKFVKFDCKSPDFCYGIFHTKFIVSDKSVLVDTSNFTGDYFISTAGISFVCHATEANNVLPLQNEMLNFYRKFWGSELAIPVEDVICHCNTTFHCVDGKVDVLRADTMEIYGCIGPNAELKGDQCVPISRRVVAAEANVGWVIIALVAVFVALLVGVYIYRRRK